jgi:lysophospholipase L1-like esterase
MSFGVTQASGVTAVASGSGGSSTAAAKGESDRLLSAGAFYQFTASTPPLSNGTDTGCNGLEARYLPNGGGDLRMSYSNRNGTGSITLSASVQWPTNLVPVALTWAGATSVTIPAGSVVTSDPFLGANNIWSCPPPGTLVYFRYFVSCASGVKFELTTTTGQGQVSGTTQTNQTLSQSFSYGGGGAAQIGMAALVGSPLVTTNSAVFAVGDSITRGEGSGVNGFGDTGPIYYATSGYTATSHPWENGAIVGETGQTFGALATSRRQLYMKYADSIVICYGTNDIGYNTSISLATLQGYMLNCWWACCGYNAKVIACTLLPRSTSTDNWETIGNQTAQAGWGTGSVAAQYNAWLRAGAPILNGAPVAVGTTGAISAGTSGHPLTSVCDWCAPLENVQGSGIWNVNGTANYLTVDGTHPTDAAAQLMGALLKPLI